MQGHIVCSNEGEARFYFFFFCVAKGLEVSGNFGIKAQSQIVIVSGVKKNNLQVDKDSMDSQRVSRPSTRPLTKGYPVPRVMVLEGYKRQDLS